MNVHVRWMIRRDKPEVLRIEQRSFALPWDAEDFTRAQRGRNCISMVAEDGQLVLGYIIYELSTTTITILNLAVDPEVRRQEVGTTMVAKLISKLKCRGREEILVDLRERNLPAQLFFRALGFSCVEVLRDHYDDLDEDAYVFQYLHPESPFSPVAGKMGARA